MRIKWSPKTLWILIPKAWIGYTQLKSWIKKECQLHDKNLVLKWIKYLIFSEASSFVNNPVHITCTYYLYILPVHITCTYNLYILPVHITCTYYLYLLPVHITCLKWKNPVKKSSFLRNKVLMRSSLLNQNFDTLRRKCPVN